MMNEAATPAMCAVTRRGGYDERTMDEVLDHYADELGKLTPFPPATPPGT